MEGLRDGFLLPKLSDVLLFGDDSEAFKIMGVPSEFGRGFINSRFVA